MNAKAALNRTLLLCRDFIRPHEASDDDIAETLTGIRVTIVADSDNLRTAAAQSAVVALAGQVLGYGSSLRLIIPDVAVVGYQPPLLSSWLREGLVDFASDLIPGGRAEIVDRPDAGDFVFLIGNTPWEGNRDRAWRLGGTRWSGVIARPEAKVPVWPDDFPIGALAAATSAAAEPFKGALIGLLSRSGADRRHDELLPADVARIILGSETLLRTPTSLGDLDVVSGGAIANSFLHALLRVSGIVGRVRVFEPETLDLTNLNRYALARRSQVGMLKIHALASWQRPDLRIAGSALRFDQTSLGDVGPLAARIVIGTDDIPSRWFVQMQTPEWLGVGATTHSIVVVSEHSVDEPCVGCLHPEDDDVDAPIPTVSFVSYWAGLVLVARLARLLADDRLTGHHQALEVAALRVDSPRGIWWHPVHRSRRCPVRCAKPLRSDGSLSR
jgi:hypothetical protein